MNISQPTVIKILISLAFCFVLSFGKAQINQSLFDNYSVTDGLTDKTIHCIFQDSKGWIWIGTDFGVLRFDGYTFKPFAFDSEESKTLNSSLIRTIYEDKNGVIWFGTELNGVFKYDRKYYRIEQLERSVLSNSSIWSIVEDKTGRLWFATEFGLNLYNPETKQIEKIISNELTPGILTHDFIRKLLIDKNNRIWIGTDNGVTVLNEDLTLFTKLLYKENYDFSLENQVWEIYQDENEAIWIGSYLGGLYKYNVLEDQLLPIDLDNRNKRALTVRSITQDKLGNLWIGSRGGLYSYNLNTQEIICYQENNFDNHSLVHNSVLSLFLDKKGDLWVGTRNGISFLNFERKAFSYLNSYSDEAKLNNSEVYTLYEDNNRNLWIGTENGGINIYNRNTSSIRYLTSKNGLSNNCIKAICPDGRGNILIGAYLGGLNCYNPKTGKNKIFVHREDDPTSISDNSVWAIYTDHKDRIWVGTSSGIDQFDPKTGTFNHFGRRFDVGWISMIYEDEKERLWLYSGDQKRLTLITTGGTIKHFPYQSRALRSAKDGCMWIATLGKGLIYLNPDSDTVKEYTMHDGLCSNVIYNMVRDGDKYLWLGTNNGISRFNTESKEFKNFSVSNGLLNSQFNYGAALLCSDNTLAFGGKLGIDFINLNELRENEYIPPVVLTGIRVFNKEVAIESDSADKPILTNFITETKDLVIPYEDNMVSFEFAALNYANVEKNQYRYKLEGFDKDWNEIGVHHTATYTNLDNGDYIFKVIGTNSDGKYDPEGLSIKLTILPPFWKTGFFRFLMMAIIAIMFYIVYGLIINREKLKHQLYYERKNARQIKELDRLKHQFFMNISHEIRTPLTLITGPLDKLIDTEMDRESQRSHLGIIKRNTHILSKLVNQLLDYRKLETGNLKLEPSQGKLNPFLEEIILPFKELAGDKGIELDYNISHQSIFFSFDADKLEKIINNLLSNAIKYTNSGGTIEFSVSIVFTDDLGDVNNFIPPIDPEKEIPRFVQFIFHDTGIGIPAGQEHKIFDRFRQVESKDRKTSSGAGIGLSLTKELVKLHHGHIRVKSTEGKGSKFVVLIPYIQQKTKVNTGKESREKGTEQSLYLDEKVMNKNQPILLIVDDNPDIRRFVKHHFEPEYKILEAADGKEGWDIVLDTIPDLIITDIMMPETDGVELCRRIKSDERSSHIPVIMLTALGSNEKQLDGIAAGAEDYIVKPFDVTLLKAKADNILYVRKALRERYSKKLLLKPKDIVLTSPDEKFLRKVIQVIEKNISQTDLDVDFLARQVGVSRTQLYRKINALTDMAAKEFVKDIRLKRAAQLISQNKLNVSEVALEVGFSDISYFRKCFKEKFGVSATKYVSQKTDKI